VSADVLNDVSNKASVHSVLHNLPNAHIVHFACHGHQKEDPLQSCFSLNDGPLTISALMELNLPNAVFAFLSACNTAKGDKNQPDQAVHLAASLLFCGFRSIIATMW
jgi:CHAT domain-containing protein